LSAFNLLEKIICFQANLTDVITLHGLGLRLLQWKMPHKSCRNETIAYYTTYVQTFYTDFHF